MRTASLQRKTAETEISLELNLDGTGQADVATGVGFFDHMLTLLGQARGYRPDGAGARATCTSISTTPSRTWASASARRCAGARATRPASAATATSRCRWKRRWSPSAIDLSGRYFLVFDAQLPTAKIGDFDSELVEDFWQAVGGQRAVQPARPRALRPQQPPHHRGDLQGDGPRPAHGRRARPAHAPACRARRERSTGRTTLARSASEG